VAVLDRKFYSPYKGAILRQNVAVYLVKNLSPQMVAIENGKNMPFLKKFFLSLYIPYFFNEK
jgi:hypothetical protein